MDRAWMYALARFDPVYSENVRHFVEEALIYFVHVLIVKTKLCGQILKWSSHT
jgi:hypothetical protein